MLLLTSRQCSAAALRSRKQNMQNALYEPFNDFEGFIENILMPPEAVLQDELFLCISAAVHSKHQHFWSCCSSSHCPHMHVSLTGDAL